MHETKIGKYKKLIFKIAKYNLINPWKIKDKYKQIFNRIENNKYNKHDMFHNERKTDSDHGKILVCDCLFGIN